MLGALAVMLARTRTSAEEAVGAQPDWSVSVAAIELPGVAVAITDRASRLTCANSEFAAAFGTAHAPPGLPLGEAAAEALTRKARAAWRDGSGAARSARTGRHALAVAAFRAGRADDYLVWRFAPLIDSDPIAEIGGRLLGPFGGCCRMPGSRRRWSRRRGGARGQRRLRAARRGRCQGDDGRAGLRRAAAQR